MATIHQQRAPGDYRVERHEGQRSTHFWRWLIPLMLGLLALWGLFGRRDHRSMDTTDRGEPAQQVPYEGR